MNMVPATLTRLNGELIASFGEHTLTLGERPELRSYESGRVVLGIRPEDFEDAAFAGGMRAGHSLTAVCALRESLGSEVLVHFSAGNANLVARVQPQTAIREGDPAALTVNTSRIHFFDPDTGTSI